MMAELEAKGLPRERFTGLAADVLPMPEPASAKSLKTACQFGRRHGMPTVSLEQAFPEWFFWRRLVPVGAVLSGLLCCWAVYPTVQALLPVEVEVEQEVITELVVDPTEQIVLNIKLPEMVVIPGGTFTMGCVEGRDNTTNSGCDADEKPAHDVTVADFELSTHEVTVAQFRDFVAASGYATTAETEGLCFSYNAVGNVDNVEGNYWQKTVYKQTDEHPVGWMLKLIWTG